MKLYFIDLFCGAGGVTTGLHNSVVNGINICEVIACVNHDANAIKSHYMNHKQTKHFTEDICTLDISELIKMVSEIRNKDPEAVICLWASLECTNFSRAKGGQPRNADSRTLAEHLYRYIEGFNPDYIFIENVEEFMCWGPLDAKGKPESKRAGVDYLNWLQHIQSYGYNYDHRILNSADYGAYTSRKRYFGLFAKPGVAIIFPEATHAKKAVSDVFGGLKKWKPVKEVLDFNDEGKSIFERSKELSEKTLARIYAGLIKYVAGGKENFILKYNSTDSKGKHTPPSTDESCPTIATQNRLGIVNVKSAFIAKYYSGKPEGKVIPVDGPAGTITCVDGQSLVQAKFLQKYHGNGNNLLSIDGPCSTLTTKDRVALVQPKYWIDKQFSSGGLHSSVDLPAGSITTIPKLNLVTTKWIMNTNFNNVGSSIETPAPVITANRKHHYIINPSWGGNNGDVNQPCCTVVARQDKAPLYLVSTDMKQVTIAIYENDPEIMIKIKEFMVLYGIVDIKMRMLKVPELLKIQGFPDGYVLIGNQADQKKFIGNSVVPLVPEKWMQAIFIELTEIRKAA